MTTGKTIALTRWIFVGKMSLLFNTLSRFAMAFLPRSKHFLISWLQSSSTMILELKKRKSVSSKLVFSSSHVWMEELDHKASWAQKNWCFWTVVLEKNFWESLGLQGDPSSPSWRRPLLGVHWKDWCWGWNSSTLATSCEELTHSKRLWCWEGLGAGGEGDDRGWDGWMAS